MDNTGKAMLAAAAVTALALVSGMLLGRYIFDRESARHEPHYP